MLWELTVSMVVGMATPAEAQYEMPYEMTEEAAAASPQCSLEQSRTP